MSRTDHIVITTDAADVARLAGSAAARDPVQNTVFATIAEWVMRHDATPFAAHPAGSPHVLVARSQPTTPVTVTNGWDSPEEIAGILGDLDPAIAAVAGPETLVEAIATVLDRPVTSRFGQRLFRLDQLAEPVAVAGHARRATIEDLDLLEAWFTDFHGETFGRPPSQSVRDLLAESLGAEPVWLWLDERDEARSFAARRTAVHGVARIGPVYTPPAQRGHGYGSAVTAAAARDILGCGAIPCLYTDLANPTSNKIYQAIGFVPVSDRVEVRFD